MASGGNHQVLEKRLKGLIYRARNYAEPNVRPLDDAELLEVIDECEHALAVLLALPEYQLAVMKLSTYIAELRGMAGARGIGRKR